MTRIYLKAYLLVFFFACNTLIAEAQKKKEENLIFEKVEYEAHPNATTWQAHINNKSKLPDSVQQLIPEGVYRVVIKFIVDVHGNLSQVKIDKDPGYGLGQRAANIIGSYTDKWTPATQCGRLVKAYRAETIVFKVTH